MNLFNFIEKFPDEEACRAHFKQFRDEQGVICKSCSSPDHYWLKSKQMYQCKKCRFRTSLKSGTVMENSKLPFQYWYMAMHLMTSTKKSFSALELQRHLGHKRYEPVWYMMHKIRINMGKAEDKHLPGGTLEMNYAFINTLPDEGSEEADTKNEEKALPREKVVVMSESRTVHDPMGQDNTHRYGRFRMLIMEELSQEMLSAIGMDEMEHHPEVITGTYSGYSKLKEYFVSQKSEYFPPEETGNLRPWTHIVTGNVKRALFGIYHLVKGRYLQSYLDEFCFKLNRRYQDKPLFSHMLEASLTPWY